MKTKSVITSGVEVLSATQLSKIKGGRKVIIIRDGLPIVIEIPD